MFYPAKVISQLPVPLLLSLRLLSRQWRDFFAAHQSVIFYENAEFIQPGTLVLEDAKASSPLAFWTRWKRFCYNSYRLCESSGGNGRAVARVLMPPGTNAHHIEVDEKAGICITSRLVTHVLSKASFQYDKGYLVFDNIINGDKEVWRLASAFSAEDEVAVDAPPTDKQMAVSTRADGCVQSVRTTLAYLTLICANHEQIVLHDVRTGSLLQTIHINLRTLNCVNVSVRHAFVCEQDVVHVFSRESGIEVLRIPADAIVRCSQLVENPSLLSGDRFIVPISVSSEVAESPRPRFIAAHVSRDGRDLVVLSRQCRLVFIRDFERICRGQTTFERAGVVLGLRPEEICYDPAFENGRVCVATVQGLYLFTFGPVLSVKAMFVRPSNDPSAITSRTGSMQLTDDRIYFT
ncbi:hypothetical protein EI94DRAFT_1800582 [Lactarius quietus]|nr:hypothetical protein EI94DRAFT_1800582 [Lactarius quietus]